MFIIRGKYKNLPWEDIDEAETKKEAEYLLGEYLLAYNASREPWQLKIVNRKGQ